ncbi:MADS-box protein SVP-like isoform X1 [Senna tora]|uniref:MADS-box protein SVP-like isoform X1 n=1 Tax=Senna tora TaxID=362788 RepID=A0A834XEJ6_9FABA|nr:MADS-box protein SVP-like isoform X1 [Senna tora]
MNRQLNGEELQGSTFEELQKLEDKLERGLIRVSKTKDERIIKQISTLKRKVQSLANEQRQSSESIIICNSSDHPPQDYCESTSDTSLKLG